MFTLIGKLRGLRSNKSGVTALEYGLIAGLIAVVIIGAVTLLGQNVSNTFNAVAGAMPQAPAAAPPAAN
jgi:pilus assembly protein Flp/PilA